MPATNFAKTLKFSVLAVLLVAAPGRCGALESIDIVTKERATELGLEIRSHAAGPDAVRVELEFETKGELKNYSRVALESYDGDKLLLSTTLREEPSRPGRIVVSFAADRTRLGSLSLKVVTSDSARSRVGHVLSMKDFVDLTKVR